jgi:tetratricopeptide (TPR) repeat protein
MTGTDEARHYLEEGHDAFRVGEYEEAIEKLAQARSLFVEAGDRTGEAEALGSLGAVLIQLEEWDRAQEAFDEATVICVETGDRSNQAKILGNLGMLYARTGKVEMAVEVYEESVSIFRDLGERGNEQAVSRQLNKLKVKRGKFLEAMGDYHEELEGTTELTGAQKIARALFRLLGRVGGGPVLPAGGESEETEPDDPGLS